MKELGIKDTPDNPIYTPTTLSEEEILVNHRSVLSSFCIETKDKSDLASLFWISKLRECAYKEKYIAGSSRCFTKPLYKLLTTILSREGMPSKVL